eukprot:Em0004g1735a
MECPTCQRSITIPEGGVNAIPQNLHLGFEVEVAGYMSKIGSDGVKSCDTTALTLQKEELMKMQDEIGHYTEMTSHIFQTHTDHEMVALGNLLPTELKATLKKVKAELLPKSHDGTVVPGEVEDHWDDIAINDYRDIYVTCSSNSSIHVFDQDGQQKLVQYCMAHMAIKRDRDVSMMCCMAHMAYASIKRDVSMMCCMAHLCINQERCEHDEQEDCSLKLLANMDQGQRQFYYPVSVLVDQRDLG